MKSGIIRKPISILLSILMVVGVFVSTASISASAALSAEYAEGKYVITINDVTRKYPLAKELLDGINAERSSRGLGSLRMDSSLLERSMVRAAELPLYFNDTDLMDNVYRLRNMEYEEYFNQHYYEGVFAVTGTADEIVSKMFASTDYKTAVNNTYAKEIGIGAVTVADNGVTFICVRTTDEMTAKGTYSAVDSSVYASDVAREQVTNTLGKNLNIQDPKTPITVKTNKRIVLNFDVKEVNGLPYKATVQPGYLDKSLDSNIVIDSTCNNAFTVLTTGSHSIRMKIDDANGDPYKQISYRIRMTAEEGTDGLAVSLTSGSDIMAVNGTTTLTASAEDGTEPYTYTFTDSNNTVLQSGTSNTYSFTPTTGGQHEITVTVTDADEESATDSVTVTAVYPLGLSFSTQPAAVSVGDNIDLIATLSDGAPPYTVKYTVDGQVLGTITTSDSSASCQTSFDTAGNHTVVINASDNIGNRISSSNTVSIALPLSISVSSAKQNASVDENVSFTIGTTGGVAPFTYSVYLNDVLTETTVTNNTFRLLMQEKGQNTVSVTATDSLGHTASASTALMVTDALTVGLTASAERADEGEEIQFTAAAAGGSGSYSYEFAVDGVTETNTTGSFSYTFANEGSYEVMVTVTDSADNTAESTISVVILPELSLQLETDETTVSYGSDVSVTASSNTENGNYYFTVENTEDYNILNNVVTLYDLAAGQYKVSCTVEDEYGRTASDELVITVAEEMVVTLQGEQNVFQINENTGFDVGVTGGVGPYAYSVYVDDTALELAVENGHFDLSFDSKGDYTVAVLVCDSLGDTKRAELQVKAYEPLTATFDFGETAVMAGEQTVISISAAGGVGDLTYVIKVDGQVVNVDNSATACFTPEVVGTYNVTAEVTDEIDNKLSDSFEIEVYQKLVVLTDLSDDIVELGKTITLDIASNYGYGNVSYSCTIDGEAATVDPQNNRVEFSFSEEGRHTVVAVATDELGNTDEKNLVVVAYPTLRTECICANNIVEVGKDVNFYLFSSGGYGDYTYTYTVNGNIISEGSESSFVYTPAEKGTYTVELKVTDELGNEAVESKNVVAYDPLELSAVPQSNVVKINDTICADVDYSGGYGTVIITYTIDGGEEKTVNLQTGSIELTFDTEGDHNITVTATDELGNTSETSFAVYAYPELTATADFGEEYVLTGSTVEISASADGGYGDYTYEFSVNGEAVYTGEESVFEYTLTEKGEYNFTVKVTDSLSNETEESATVIAYDELTVGAQPETDVVKIGETVNAAVGSTGGYGNVTFTYVVDGGEAQEVNNNAIELAFESEGDYNITVTATDELGNTAETSFGVYAYPELTATADFGEEFVLTGTTIEISTSADGGYGDYTYEFSVNGEAVYTGENDSVEYTLTEKGEYLIRVKVTDSLSNETEESATVIAYDELALSVDPEESIVKTNEIAVTNVDCTGGYGNLVLTYSVDDGEENAVDTEKNTIELSFEDNGEHHVTVNAVDELNNTASASFTVISYYPLYTRCDVSEEYVLTGTEVGISVSTYGGYGAFSYVVKVNDSVIYEGDDPGTTFEPDAAGTYSISVVATDSLGNTHESTATVTAYDELTVDAQPETDVVKIGETVNAAVGSTGGYGNVTFTYSVDGGEAQEVNNNAIELAFESEGDHNITVTATDELCNTAETSFGVYAYPELTATADFGEEFVLTGTTIEISTSADGGYGDYTYEFSVNGEAVYTGEESVFEYTLTEKGEYAFRVKVTDSLSNETEESATVIAYNALALSVDPEESIVETNEIAVTNVDCTGGYGNLVLTYSVDGGEENAVDTEKNAIELSFEDNGEHHVTVNAVDELNNTASASFTVISYYPLYTRCDVSEEYVLTGTEVGISVSTYGGYGTFGYVVKVNDSVVYEGDIPETTFEPDAAGTYSISVVATDSLGNTHESTATVIAYDELTVSAQPETDVAKIGESVNAAVGSTGGYGEVTFTYVVDGGNKQEVNGDIIVLSFDTEGDHNITVTATDELGNTAETSFAVYAYPELTATADFGEEFVLTGTTIEISANAEGGYGDYTYEFSVNGEAVYTGENDSVEYTLTEKGEYNFTVKVTDSLSNETEESATVTAYDELTVDAQAETDVVKIGETVNAAVGSTGGYGNVTFTYSVDGGEAQEVNNNSIELTFDTEGDHNITVTATDELGNTSETSFAVYAYPELTATADFGEEFVLTGTTIEISANAEGGYGDYTYEFSVNGEAVYTGEESVFEYTLTEKGEYAFKVKVTDSLSNETEESATVTAYDELTVSAQPDTDVAKIGESVNAAVGSTGGYGNVTFTYAVDGGNEQEVNNNAIELTFDTEGDHNITVTATDELGNTAETGFAVHAYPELTATADFGEEFVLTGTTIEISANADGGYGDYTYEFSVNGEAVYTGEESVFEYTLTEKGEYNFTVKVTDSLSNETEESATVIAYDALALSVDPEESIVKTNEIAVTNVDCTGGYGNLVLTYSVDSGEENTVDTEKNTIELSFEDNGEHHVTVTAIDELNNTVSASFTVISYYPLYTRCDLSGEYVLTGTEVGISVSTYGGYGAFSYVVKVNDSVIYEGDDPGTTFEPDAAGTYGISVVTTDSLGNTHESTATVTAYDELTVSAQADTDVAKIGESVNAAVGSTGGYGEVTFTYAVDGGEAQEVNNNAIELTFDTEGDHNITVTATDELGNTAETSFAVYAYPELTATADFGEEYVLTGSTVEISANADGGYGDYTYEFSVNGEAVYTGEESVFEYTLTEKGEYLLRVRVTDSLSNETEESATVIAYDELTVDAQAETDVVKIGETVNAAVGSTGGYGEVTFTYVVDGGEAQEVNNNAIELAFEAEGDHNITVTATDELGNTAETGFAVSVYSSLVNTSTVNASELYAGSRVEAYGSATGGVGPYSYAYSYKRTTGKVWNNMTSSNGDAYFNAKTAGDFLVRVIATDSIGNTDEKIIPVSVINLAVVNDSTAEIEKTENGTRITIIANTKEGTAPFTYTYYYKRTTSNYWKLLGEENTISQSVSFTSRTPGAFDIRTIVTDARGTSDEKVFTILDELTNLSYLDCEVVAPNTLVTVTGAAEGGTGNISYAFYYLKDGGRVWRPFGEETGDSTQAGFRPKSEGKYYVKSVAKDENGTTSEKIMEFTVISASGEELVNVSEITEQIALGEKIVMNGSAQGGSGEYTYTYAYRRSETAKWRTIGTANTTDSTASFKPTVSGTICIRITVTDSLGNTAARDFTATVTE